MSNNNFHIFLIKILPPLTISLSIPSLDKEAQIRDDRYMDPKQQEAYNRIMTTPTPSGAQAPTQPEPPAQNPFSSSTNTPQTSAEKNSAKPNPPIPTAVVPPTETPTATPLNPLPSPAAATAQKIQATSMPPMLQALYIIAALVFFIVYTIFWIKIFNLSTPLPF